MTNGAADAREVTRSGVNDRVTSEGFEWLKWCKVAPLCAFPFVVCSMAISCVCVAVMEVADVMALTGLKCASALPPMEKTMADMVFLEAEVLREDEEEEECACVNEA